MTMPLIKEPSAYLPLAMSLAALTLLFGHVAVYGIVRQADEGAAARVFQLLLVTQLPIVLAFAIKWLPRAPRQALIVMILQAAAGLFAIGAVAFLESSP